ncbi:MAG: D-alanyl-D-alanine carboxypeptidase [Oscillospiraceae bacterium]|nr:D-alanyl-D-alanine carboxypeptidase [Oscillospiraceae bacterium]
MKKISAFLLALLTLLCLCFPAYASETEDPTAQTVQETTAEPAVEETAPVVAYGTASVTSGCRTIEAQVPLGGSERMLESAQSAFVFEENTGTVIYAYNPDMKMSPGGLNMIMTAIVAIEKGNLDDEVTISTRNYSSLPAGALNQKLKEGEVMTLRDLLYCMVLGSANDAAITIAEHISGNETSFVIEMNQYASQIGCLSTVFTNCHGQSDANQCTTARDMVRIMEYCMRNSTFAELFAANSYDVPATNKSEKRELKSTNYLREQTIVPKLNYKDVTAGKQSYSASTGAHVVCTAERNGLSLICVVMGGTRIYNDYGNVTYYGNFEEVMELMDFSFDGYKVCRLLHEGQSMSQFTVAGGENQVVGQTHTSMDAVLPADARLDNLILKYSVTGGGLIAPVKLDQQIATLQIWYRTSCIAETELYAMSSVRSTAESELDIRSTATRDDSNLSDILSFLGVACLVVLVPLVIYLFVNNLRRTIARNRRRRRRKNRRRSR